MRKLEVYLTIGYPAADHRETIEVPDDATEDEIEQDVQEWAYNYIDYGWKEKKS